MITLTEQRQCLAIAKHRKQVNDLTTFENFITAINNELDELVDTDFLISEHLPEYSDTAEEIADVVITCMSMAEFYDIDLGKVIEAKIRYNNQRTD